MRASHWLKILIEPKSTGDDSRRREFILNVLLASSTFIGILALAVVVFQSARLGPDYGGEPPLYAVLQVVLFAGLWFLSRKGFFVSAAYALVSLFLLLAFFMLTAFGVFFAQGLLLLALVLVMSSILLGTRVSVVLALAASVGLVTLSALQQSGKLAFDSGWTKIPAGPNDAIGLSLTFVIITVVFWLSNREIERFNATLQDKVTEATARLRVANRHLKDLDKAKDEFLSMASHQLGTPLTAITGYLSMALDDDHKNMTGPQRQYVQYGLEAAENMGAMTSDLLNVSRLSAGRFVIRAEATDFAKIVRDEIKQLGPAAERKGLGLRVSVAADIPTVSMDISKTRQVIMNFIDNAIYYTEKGFITIKAERRDNSVAFTVTDTGLGVPENEKAKLFTKFYRAENARSVRPDGTGLGLYLAKRVIEDQGGTLIFESVLGKGSTFGFLLPLVAKTPPAPSLPATKK